MGNCLNSVPLEPPMIEKSTHLVPLIPNEIIDTVTLQRQISEYIRKNEVLPDQRKIHDFILLSILKRNYISLDNRHWHEAYTTTSYTRNPRFTPLPHRVNHSPCDYQNTRRDGIDIVESNIQQSNAVDTTNHTYQSVSSKASQYVDAEENLADSNESNYMQMDRNILKFNLKK